MNIKTASQVYNIQFFNSHLVTINTFCSRLILCYRALQSVERRCPTPSQSELDCDSNFDGFCFLQALRIFLSSSRETST